MPEDAAASDSSQDISQLTMMLFTFPLKTGYQIHVLKDVLICRAQQVAWMHAAHALVPHALQILLASRDSIASFVLCYIRYILQQMRSTPYIKLIFHAMNAADLLMMLVTLQVSITRLLMGYMCRVTLLKQSCMPHQAAV